MFGRGELLVRSWLEGWRLDVAFTVLTVWLIGGTTWDFYHHASGISFEEEGFLTEPHLTFYSAFLFIVGLAAAATVVNRRDGADWRAAIPPGYRYGALGMVLFAVGAPADFLWHSTFGAEQGTEVLTSPTHLLLATGVALFVSSPLRAMWFRGVEKSLVRQLPLLFSAGFVTTTITSFGLYGNPMTSPIANNAGIGGAIAEGHGVLQVATFSAVLVGISLLLARRFDLQFGAFLVLFTLIGLPDTAGRGFVLLPALMVAGLVADILSHVLEPGSGEALPFRTFAAAVPLTTFAGYFAIHHAVWGIEWSTHLWAGAIVVGAAAGILVSYLVQPYSGAQPGDQERAP